MELGPGAYVGPVFVILGLVLVVRRTSAAKLLAWFSRNGGLATSRGAIICGATCMVMGGFATAVGLHTFR